MINKENCPYAKKCGGCDLWQLPYAKQLEQKQTMIRKLMEPYGRVLPIVGMEEPLHYRHKVHAVFGVNRQGHILAGTYKKNSHEIVDIDSCMIEDERADALIREIKYLLRSFKIRAYAEDSRFGLLRHVLIRKSYATGEMMVVLVLTSPMLPSKNNFVKALRKKFPEISTVVINVNDKKTSMVLGERNITIYGKGFITDRLCSCSFRISPSSFYQVNPRQTELLYREAIDCAGLSGEETVIDAYCGTGTIGIIAAQKAKQVIGVELNRDAVKDAITNARLNDRKNILFHNADAGNFMVEMAAQGEKADVVIMDPPRTGSNEAFLKSVCTLGPKKIVYVSCGPESLARDLKFLTKQGYQMTHCRPFDCFPYTGHVETVVCLVNQNRKYYQ